MIPIDKLVLIFCPIMVQLFVISEVYSFKILDVYRHTTTHSHLGLAATARLRTASFMMWMAICISLSLRVIDSLVLELVESYYTTVHGRLCRWLFSGTRWLFCVTDEAVDIQLLSQVPCLGVFMPMMSWTRDIQAVPFSPPIFTRFLNWQKMSGLSPGPSQCRTPCCVDDSQRHSPATSRPGGWSLKTAPRPEPIQCEIVVRNNPIDLRVESYQIEYRLNRRHRRPAHKLERCQSPYVAAKRRRRMSSPYVHNLADARLVQ
ncbi:hypothetical protein DEU56DRAFT_414796 [Suillus clintonianus]|uniref:uncharacterized protein n=1 Tax=Suillus clintonianus TaxID=1904413 RepID=UPI001B860D99|nr:uncharacterized protein DEU56DRAFT_414796 [Suillus clintonianus]KAG2133716.1 hypothetical protein DEU56DRAFT_414796 [Suillus clintonianus]